MIVEVEGLGRLEFPDDTPEDIIDRTVKRELGVTVEPDQSFIRDSIESNRDKPFIQRFLKPDEFPKLKEGDWDVSHKMASAEVQGHHVAYPTVQMREGKLVDLGPEEGLRSAIESNNFIEFEDAQSADTFARTYKSYKPPSYVGRLATDIGKSALQGAVGDNLRFLIGNQQRRDIQGEIDKPELYRGREISPNVQLRLREWAEEQSKMGRPVSIDEWKAKAVQYNTEERDNAVNKMQGVVDRLPEPSVREDMFGKAMVGASRFLGSMAVSVASPIAGTVLVFTQITGSSYEEYVKQGVDKERAWEAATINALLQTPIEQAGNLLQIGFLKHLGRTFIKGGVGTKRIIDFVEMLGKSAVAEGLEEGLQVFPEEIAHKYAANPHMSSEEIVRDIMSRWKEIVATKGVEAFKLGAIGGMGLMGAAGAIQAPFTLGAYVDEKTHEKAIKKFQKNPKELIDGLKEAAGAGLINQDDIEAIKETVPEEIKEQFAKEVKPVEEILAEPEEVAPVTKAPGEVVTEEEVAEEKVVPKPEKVAPEKVLEKILAEEEEVTPEPVVSPPVEKAPTVKEEALTTLQPLTEIDKEAQVFGSALEKGIAEAGDIDLVMRIPDQETAPEEYEQAVEKLRAYAKEVDKTLEVFVPDEMVGLAAERVGKLVVQPDGTTRWEETHVSEDFYEGLTPIGVPEAAPKVTPTVPGATVRQDVFFQKAFADKQVPKLEKRISDLHNALYMTESFAKSEFYDKTFPIPKKGGIVAARESKQYEEDAAYKKWVDDIIKEVTDTMVKANRQRMILLGTRSTGSFGVAYQIEMRDDLEETDIAAGYSGDWVRAWNNEARQKYPYTSRLGDVAVREALQNSLDAVLEAQSLGQIKNGKIDITIGTDMTGYTIEDNGIGLDAEGIKNYFLSLFSTGKEGKRTFGNFGIAKAVTLGPHEKAEWTVETQGFYHDSKTAAKAGKVKRLPKGEERQGMKLSVDAPESIMTQRAFRYIETTEVPKNISLVVNGQKAKYPFSPKKKFEEHERRIGDHVSASFKYYPRAPEGYEKQMIIRLYDPIYNARLTQSITHIWNDGFAGTVVVDIEIDTKEDGTPMVEPGMAGYPLTDSRMEFAYDGKQTADKIIEKHSVDPLSAKRVGVESVMDAVGARGEWKGVIESSKTDPEYEKVYDTIAEVFEETGNFYGAERPELLGDMPVTPLHLRVLKRDKGVTKRPANKFLAKHMIAYEATARLMAQPAGAKVGTVYAMLPKIVDGGTVGAEYNAASGDMGFSLLSIDETAMNNPVEYAMYLRDLVAHELAHYYQGAHNEDYSSAREMVARNTSHTFPHVLKIAEAVLGETAADLRTAKAVTEVTRTRYIEKKIGIDRKQYDLMFPPEHQEGGLRNAERELYYPEDKQGKEQFWLFGRRGNDSELKQFSKTGDVGVRGRHQFPTTPAFAIISEGIVLPEQQKAVEGDRVTQPASTYDLAVKTKGKNVYVKESITEPNTDRVLLTQIAYKLTQEKDISTSYFDKLYEKRSGYARPDDFWEIPQWIGEAAHTFPKSDVYVIRDVDEAVKFLNAAGYGTVMFSAMDVNKNVIRELAGKYDGRIIVGGYIGKTSFKDLKNVEWHDSLESAAKTVGVPYKTGSDLRHFKGTKTVPRLCMSTGCLHKCAFCTVSKEVKAQPSEVIDKHLEAMKGLDFELVYLDDKTFGQAKNYKDLINIKERLQKQNKKFKGFIIQTTAPQLLKLDDQFLKDSGIKYVELGVETYNDDILKRIHKPHSTKLINKAVGKLRANEIDFIPNILVGLAGKTKDGKLWTETEDTYQNTLDFLDANSDIISHVNVYNLALYEGTELAEQIEAKEDVDINENAVERSYLKDKVLHEGFYKKVLAFGKKMLDKEPGVPIEKGSTFSSIHESLANTDKYSVSVFPDLTNTIKGRATPAQLSSYWAKNQKYLDKYPNLGIGTWYDEKSKQTYLDVVVTIPRKGNRRRAIELGRKYNQKSIFDLKTMEEIKTGGTGEVREGLQPIDKRMKEIEGLLRPKKVDKKQTLAIGRMSRKQLADLKGLSRAIRDMLIRKNAPKEVLDRIEIDIVEWVNIDPDAARASLEAWQKEGYDISEPTLLQVPGATTFLENGHAVIQLSLYHKNFEDMMETAYHEYYEIAREWLLPMSDLRVLKRHFKTTEGEAMAFARIAKDERDLSNLPGPVRRVLLRMKRYLQMIRNWLKGKGFTRPEDIFGKLLVGAYTPHFGEGAAQKLQFLAVEAGEVAMPAQPGMHVMQSPEREKQWRDAEKAPEPAFLFRVKDIWNTFWHKALREYEHLPRRGPEAGEFAELRASLLKLAKQKGVVTPKAQEDIKSITEGLSPVDIHNFTRLIVFRDFLEEIELRKEKGEIAVLPGEMTEEELTAEIAAIEPLINNDIKAALSKRKRKWNELRIKYIAAMKSIGINVEERLKREHYFRHVVLDYIESAGVYGTGERLKAPTYRSHLKQRTGAKNMIMVNYAKVEHEVMAQMLYDIELANTIKSVDVNYNEIALFKQQAADLNFRNVMTILDALAARMPAEEGAAPITGESLYRQLGRKTAIGLDNMGRLAAADELWADSEGKFDDFITALGRNWAENKALKQEMGKDWTANDRIPLQERYASQLLTYANWVLKTKGAPGKTAAATVFKGVHEKRQAIADLLGPQFATWKKLVKDHPDYTEWQPDRGNIFFNVHTIPEQIAEDLMSGALETAGIGKSQIKRMLALGGRKKSFVVKNEVAATLDNLTANEGINLGPNRWIVKKWKQWQLLMPRRLIKYNFRNLTGDADAMFAGNIHSFKKVPQAFKELLHLYMLRSPVFAKNKKLVELFGEPGPISEDMQDWMDRGGPQTLLQAQEMDDVSDIIKFGEGFMAFSKGVTWKDAPLKLIKGYWKIVRRATDMREAVLRYANYLDYMESMRADPIGKPHNFGASVPQEIMGMSDIKDRAFFLSNDLLGAYDRVSNYGQSLRRHWIPFWSWKEVNFRRYVRIVINAYHDKGIWQGMGKTLTKGVAIRTPFLAVKGASVMLSLFWFQILLGYWNSSFGDDEEENLPEDVRKRPHMLFPSLDALARGEWSAKNDDGKIQYFSRVGAIADLLEWVSLDTSRADLQDIMEGRMTVAEKVKEIWQAPINVVVQGGNPFLKVGTELLSRQALFPDVFKPRVIRNNMMHLARSMGVENEYVSLMDTFVRPTPNRGYVKSLKKLAVYESDEFESAYYDNYANKRRFMKKIGKYGEGFWLTPKGTALYNARTALRYNDDDAMFYYMQKYFDLGGTKKGLMKSLQNLHPMAGIAKKDRAAYIASLGPGDLDKLIKAMVFYVQLRTGINAQEVWKIIDQDRKQSPERTRPPVESIGKLGEIATIKPLTKREAKGGK